MRIVTARRSGRATCAVLATALAVVPGATALAAVPGAADGARVPTVRTPLPTSLVTSGGTWASVPMGHLHQRLNTFWQLFYLPAGGQHWTNRVGGLGIATNGGLDLATARPGDLVVGIGPADNLHYSALAATSDAGETWHPGPPLPGRAEGVAASGTRLWALIASSSGGKVLGATTSANASWHAVASAPALRRSGRGAPCAPRALTAVGTLGANALVGAACGRPGAIGLYRPHGSSWQRVAPALPERARYDTATVVGLSSTGTGALAVVVLTSPAGHRALAAAFLTSNGAQLTALYPLAAGTQLASAGAAGHGAFALLRLADGREVLVASSGPRARWASRPVPRGTATVAFPRAGETDALAVSDSTLTAYRWSSRRQWDKTEVVHVTIEFGSS